jgi:hypothetical protein
MMRTQSRGISRQRRPLVNEEYFERKARELIVADDEIEAWELDAQDLDGITEHGDSFGTSGAD